MVEPDGPGNDPGRQGETMNHPSKTKKVLYGGFAALGLTMGAAGLAAAATNQTAPKPPAANTEHAAEGGDRAPTYSSSVQDPTGANGAEGTNESDAGEAARLKGLATVTPDQAKAAATAAVPGKAAKVELESENGNVVYGVEVTTAQGTVDVKVDAGNAKVLSQETDDANEHGDKGDKGGDAAEKGDKADAGEAPESDD